MRNDPSKTLEQLESDYWGPPPTGPDVSGLVINCHLLRQKRIKDLTIEDLRLLIGQNRGLEYITPFAINYLQQNIMSEGDLYEGDLLHNVLGIKADYWKSHKKERHLCKCLSKEKIRYIILIWTTNQNINY